MPVFDASSRTRTAQVEPASFGHKRTDTPFTPAQILVQQAADGRRGAAWRLLQAYMENDPRAEMAICALEDDRLAACLLECLALQTWAGKPFLLPPSLRSSYARARLRTLFVSSSGINAARGERVLLAALSDRHLAVREAALSILGLIHSRTAVPRLIQALHDPLPSTRIQAIRALGHSSYPEAVPALLAALHGADEQSGVQIFLALTNLGHCAVPALIEVSQSNSARMRWHSIRALAEIRDPRSFLILINALQDSDHSVAWMAARGLLPFGRACIEPILHMLTRAEMTPWLRETASYILRTHCQQDGDLTAALDPLLQEMHRSSYKDGTAYLAFKALEQLKAHSLVG
jgi:HEAT repeat protein